MSVYRSLTSNVDIGEEVIAVEYTSKHRCRNIDVEIHLCAAAFKVSYMGQIWV